MYDEVRMMLQHELMNCYVVVTSFLYDEVVSHTHTHTLHTHTHTPCEVRMILQQHELMLCYDVVTWIVVRIAPR